MEVTMQTEEHRLLAEIARVQSEIESELLLSEHHTTQKIRQLQRRSSELQKELAVHRNPALQTVLR